MLVASFSEVGEKCGECAAAMFTPEQQVLVTQTLLPLIKESIERRDEKKEDDDEADEEDEEALEAEAEREESLIQNIVQVRARAASGRGSHPAGRGPVPPAGRRGRTAPAAIEAAPKPRRQAAGRGSEPCQEQGSSAAGRHRTTPAQAGIEPCQEQRSSRKTHMELVSSRALCSLRSATTHAPWLCRPVMCRTHAPWLCRP
eukprot:644027-Prymnesium_polylepis.1